MDWNLSFNEVDRLSRVDQPVILKRSSTKISQNPSWLQDIQTVEEVDSGLDHSIFQKITD